ncbi:hypothetical protein SANTM175S_09529 [Streptomyces antimycoticus]
MDGGVWTQYWNITLPLCRPALAALATLQFTWMYNDFLWALVFISDGEKPPITSALNNLRGQFFTDYNLLAAGSGSRRCPRCWSSCCCSATSSPDSPSAPARADTTGVTVVHVAGVTPVAQGPHDPRPRPTASPRVMRPYGPERRDPPLGRLRAFPWQGDAGNCQEAME